MFLDDFSTQDLSWWKGEVEAGCAREIVPDGWDQTPGQALVSLSGARVTTSRQWYNVQAGSVSADLRAKADRLAAPTRVAVSLEWRTKNGPQRALQSIEEAGHWQELHLTAKLDEPSAVKLTVTLEGGPGRAVIDDVRMFAEVPMTAVVLVPDSVVLEGEALAVAGRTVVLKAPADQETFTVRTSLVDYSDRSRTVDSQDIEVSANGPKPLSASWRFEPPKARRLYALVSEILPKEKGGEGQKQQEQVVGRAETVILDRRSMLGKEGARSAVKLDGLWRAALSEDAGEWLRVRLPTRIRLPRERDSLYLSRPFALPGPKDGTRWELVLARTGGLTEVMIGGRKVAAVDSGGEARVDVTEFAGTDRPQDLLVRVSGPAGGTVGMGSARFEQVPLIRIDGLSVTLAAAEGTVSFRCTIANNDVRARQFALEAALHGEKGLLHKAELSSDELISVGPGEKRVLTLDVPAEGVPAWEPGMGGLCTAVVRLHSAGKVVDSCELVKGFRDLALGDGVLTAGGRVFPLRIHRLDDSSEGCLRVRSFVNAMATWRRRGRNTLMGDAMSFPDPLLDACDLVGMGVICGLSPRALSSDSATQAGTVSLQRRPSIVTWAVARGEEAALVREVDGTRPVAAPSPGADILLCNADLPSEQDPVPPRIVLSVGSAPPKDLREATLLLGEKGFGDDDFLRKATDRYYRDLAREYRGLPLVGFEMVALDESSQQAAMDALRDVQLFFVGEKRSFHAGEAARVPAMISCDRAGGAKVEIAWRVEVQGRRVGGGSASEAMQPGTRWISDLTFDAPAAGQRGEMVLTATMSCGGVSRTRTRVLSVLPRPGTIKMARPVGLICPGEEAGAVLDALDVAHQVIETSAAVGAQRYDVIVVGAMDASGWGAFDAALDAFVRQGGRVVVLSQTSLAGVFARWGKVTAARAGARAFVRAWGHPLLAGLEEEDLSFGDAQGPPLSITPESGARSVLISPSAEGRMETLLAEARHGKGMLIFCQINLLGAAASHPAGGWLLRNILAEADAFKANGRARAALLAGEGSLARTLGELTVKVGAADLGGKAVSVAMLDASAEISDDAWAAIAAWVNNGGFLYFYDADREAARALSKALGRPIVAAPRAETRLSAQMGEPLMWGISPGWFTWPDGNSVRASVKATDAHEIISPGALVILTVGQGRVVMDQVRWCDAPEAEKARARAYGLTLLGNLGVDVSSQVRAEASQPTSQ